MGQGTETSVSFAKLFRFLFQSESGSNYWTDEMIDVALNISLICIKLSSIYAEKWEPAQPSQRPAC
jgi:hypothetical protein